LTGERVRVRVNNNQKVPPLTPPFSRGGIIGGCPLPQGEGEFKRIVLSISVFGLFSTKGLYDILFISLNSVRDNRGHFVRKNL
jgi:hypothetical protein